MNDQLTEEPTITQRITDAALIVIAMAAVASWLWRRLRKNAKVDAAAGSGEVDTQAIDDKVGAAIGFSSESDSR